MNYIDARGKACPQPVIMTKKAIEKIGSQNVTTIVDNQTARDNIIKLANKLNCLVSIQQINSDYYIEIEKGENLENKEKVTFEKPNDSYAIIVGANTLGRGSDELGSILMRGFFYSLIESERIPEKIVFINSGVKLTTEGSDIKDSLISLEAKGVQILSCGTCLDYYNLKDKLVLGEITNMYTIIDIINETKKVVNI